MSNDMARQLMERVKQLRERLELTQEQFAERAGLKYKHYQAVEAGRKLNIHFETLLKMARACEVEPWQLLCFEEPAPAFAEKQKGYEAERADSSAKKPTPKKRAPKRAR